MRRAYQSGVFVFGLAMGYALPMRIASAYLLVMFLAAPALADEQSSASSTLSIPTVKTDPELTRQKRLDSLLGQLHHAPKTFDVTAIEKEISEIWKRNKSATAEVLLQESTVAMAAEDFDPAETMLSQLLETYPKFAAGWARRAYLYQLMDRPDAALIDINHALELEPRDYVAYALKGVILVGLKKGDEAIAAFRQALAINPNLPAVEAGIKKIEKEEPHV